MPLDVDGTKYKSRTDRTKEQNEYISEYSVDVYDKFKDDDSEDFRGYFASLAFINKIWGDIFIADMNWIMLSILLVWLYITFHVRSIFLGMAGMLQILFSFPISVVIYRWVLQINYYSFL